MPRHSETGVRRPLCAKATGTAALSAVAHRQRRLTVSGDSPPARSPARTKKAPGDLSPYTHADNSGAGAPGSTDFGFWIRKAERILDFGLEDKKIKPWIEVRDKSWIPDLSPGQVLDFGLEEENVYPRTNTKQHEGAIEICPFD
jgi:hypothetical protein